jgi:hypothetical protein
MPKGEHCTHTKPTQKTSISPIFCLLGSLRVMTKGIGRKKIIKSAMMWAYVLPILTGKLRHFPSTVLSQTASRGMQSMKEDTKIQMAQDPTMARMMLVADARPTYQEKRLYSSRMEILVHDKLVA